MTDIRHFDSSERSDNGKDVHSYTFTNNTYRLIQQLQKPGDCDTRFFKECLSFVPEIALYLNTSSAEEDCGIFPSLARCATVGGCVLLADISGFTKLSAAAHEKGSAGLDYFRLQTDAFLSEFVDIVYENGGEVLFFAGDALLCLFRPESNSYSELSNKHIVSAECCYRTVAAALAMNRLSSRDLRAHTAICSGDVMLAALGGYDNKYSLLMHCDGMAELSGCIAEAGPQQLVVTPDVIRGRLSGLVEAYPLESGNYYVKNLIRMSSRPCSPLVSPVQAPKVISTDTAHMNTLHNFVPYPVLSALANGTFDQLREFRNVVTLFMNLDSYSPTEHRDLTTLQSYYFAMQEIIYENGGHIRQFIIDDKGCVLIVLWGVPTASFSNNCSRAVRCAAAMVAKTKYLNHACSIGITTGVAYCGTLGSSRRQDFVAVGRTVNLAARFMAKAHGRILLDQNTYDSLYCDVSSALSPVHPGLTLKGFDRPVPAYVYDSQFIVNVSPIDVKRDAELVLKKKVIKQLKDAVTKATELHDAISRELSESPDLPLSNNLRTCVMIIKGARGTGKTTLLTKFYRDVHRNGTGAISARLFMRHANQPYALFRKLLKQWLSPKRLLDAQPFREILLNALLASFPREHTDHIIRTRLPALLEVMGYSSYHETTPPTSDAQQREDDHTTSTSFWLRGPFHRMWRRVATDKVAPESAYGGMSVLDHTLLMLALHCAKECRSTVILIDGAEHMCEDSWNIFHRLAADYYFPGMIVFSVLDNSAPRDLERLAQRRMMHAGDMVLQADVISCNLMHPYGTSPSSHSQSSDNTRSKMRRSPLVSAENFIWQFASLPDATVVTLAPLNELQIVQLVHNEMGHKDISEEVLQVIRKVSQGVPSLVALMARFARESGTAALSSLIARGSEQTLLASCLLSQYSTQQQSVLKHASIIGEEIYVDILENIVSSQIRHKLQAILLSLYKDGMLIQISRNVCCFQNSMIRDVIHAIIPPSDVPVMHLNVVRAYESMFPLKLKQVSPQLAYHYALSPPEYRQDAFQYALQASKMMVDNCELTSAFCFLSVALKVSRGKNELSSLLRVAQRSVSVAETYINLDDDDMRSDVAYRLVCLREKIILSLKEANRTNQCAKCIIM